MSVREDNSWFKLELKLHNVQDTWNNIVDEEGDEYFSFGGQLNGDVEKNSNASLAVMGPMVETYIKELGSQLFHKLSRSKITGIVETSPFLIPWQVMVQLMRMVKGYGGLVTATKKKHSKEKVFSIRLPHETCQKIWHLNRCRKKYLSKRNFIKDASGKYVYNGCSKVVVSTSTPMIATYKTETQKIMISFYIQRYGKDDQALDLALQSKMNQ